MIRRFRFPTLLALAAALIALGIVSSGGAADAADSSRTDVIIGFKGQPGPAEQALVQQAGGSIKYTYHLVPAIAASVPEAAIAGLQANPNVTSVDLDGEVHAIDAELDNAWGVKRIGAGIVHASGNKGAGVKVAIIDTGADYTHPDLNDNFDLSSTDRCTGGLGHDFVNNDTDPMDDHGHGTHVSGTVAAKDDNVGVVGVAPEACLYALKVLSASGSGSWNGIIAALQWAVDHGIQVTNNSYGSSINPGGIVQAAFDNSAAGIVHVASAGNSGNCGGKGNNVVYPARFASVIAVAATDKNDARPCFSSTGPDVELAAPGVAVNSTVPKPGEDGDGCALCDDSGYKLLNGTSMASPHVAGTAALVIAAGITDVRTQLQTTADDLGDAGRDPQYGFGLVDADGAVAPAEPDATPPAAPTGLTATAGDGSVSLDWDDNAEPDLDSYNVKRSTTSGGPYTQIATGVATSAYTDNTVTNGTTYYYVVTAVDTSTNESANSTEASATPEADTTAPVISGVTTDVTDTSATITWTTDEPADSRVDYGLDAGYGPFVFDASLVTSHSITLTGLSPSTEYHYKVTSVDAASNSASSGDLTFTTAAAAPGDTVTITKAVYNSKKHGGELKVDATSSASSGDPTIKLQITHLDGVKLATPIDMIYSDKKDKYSVTVSSLTSKPNTVTVTSSLGGSDTSAVGGK